MDDGKGKFIISDGSETERSKLEKQFPDHGGWFRVGQVVEINGSRFRVKSVKPDELRLKLLPRLMD